MRRWQTLQPRCMHLSFQFDRLSGAVCGRERQRQSLRTVWQHLSQRHGVCQRTMRSALSHCYPDTMLGRLCGHQGFSPTLWWLRQGMYRVAKLCAGCLPMSHRVFLVQRCVCRYANQHIALRWMWQGLSQQSSLHQRSLQSFLSAFNTHDLQRRMRRHPNQLCALW